MKFGTVSDYDAKRNRARIYFPDSEIISGWLPVSVISAAGIKIESALKIGETVGIIENSDGTGIILGAYYPDTNAPEYGKSERTRLKFPGGLVIFYDDASDEMKIQNSSGSLIKMQGGEIILQDGSGSFLKLSGGKIEFDSSSGGNISMQGEKINMSNTLGSFMTMDKNLIDFYAKDKIKRHAWEFEDIEDKP